MKTYSCVLFLLFVSSCSKQNDIKPGRDRQPPDVSTIGIPGLETGSFQAYTIQQGAHYSDQSSVRAVTGTCMSFIVKFDSSAFYPAEVTDYNHALDANKLYGFSEGSDNQQNSARIGWRFYSGQLQLMAYVHKDGVIQRDPVSYDPPVIKSVSIGKEIVCSIAVSGYSYLFTVDGVSVTMPRATGTTTFNGLQQFPYFGGTMVAPHKITIYIK